MTASARRSTSNKNVTGSSKDRAARRRYLVDTFGWRLPDGTGLVNCYRCHVPLLENEDPEAPRQSLTVDRIVPGALGGKYTRDNIRPACAPCNESTGGSLGYAQRCAA